MKRLTLRKLKLLPAPALAEYQRVRAAALLRLLLEVT